MKNEMEELKKLAEIFKRNVTTLYLIGGTVRDEILTGEISFKDIDVCSSLEINDIKKMLVGTHFKLEKLNSKLNVTKIYNENICVEYACFRKEIYKNNGRHNPSEVTFIKDISEDAKRRDFTINCIYKNILTNEIFDPYNGMSDIENKIINTIETPEFVFSKDALRIIRAVRFLVNLEFNFNLKTLYEIKKQAFKIESLSCSIIKKEWQKINKQNEAQKIFIEIGVWEIINSKLKEK